MMSEQRPSNDRASPIALVGCTERPTCVEKLARGVDVVWVVAGVRRDASLLLFDVDVDVDVDDGGRHKKSKG